MIAVDAIPRFKKERHLRSLSEDDFRDTVVRPLLLRLGYKDGRDLCGPAEAGKDAIFSETNKLGLTDIIAVQTKKGNLSLASKVSANLVAATTQLNTALSTPVTLLATKERVRPNKAILCASGKINDAAKQHVRSEITNPNVLFLDADELIPLVDKNIPEVWLGINMELLQYFEAIKELVEDTSILPPAVQRAPGASVFGVAASDSKFVPLNLFRTVVKLKRGRRGKTQRYTDFEEFPFHAVANKKHQRVLVLGDAGSGKSTGLLRIAYALARLGLEEGGQHRIPVLVRALDILHESPRSMRDICAIASKPLSGTDRACFSTKDLVEGNVILLIDSLDELPTDEARSFVLKLVEDALQAYPLVKVVATSRPYAFTGYLPELTRFVEYAVSPITWKQARRILNSIKSQKALDVAPQELLRRLERMHGIELNPLLVTVFAATTDYSKQDIPANITELFKKFTELMLGRWDESKGLSFQYQAPVKDFVLTKLAFDMHSERLTRIRREDAEAIVKRELVKRGYEADAAILLSEIFDRSGLFRIIDDDMEFRHHLLQEFFAGRGIESAEICRPLVGDDWWQRALVFYFGEHPQQVSELEHLARSVTSTNAKQSLVGATTVGLALQACYLSPVVQKLDVWKWVVDALSACRKAFVEAVAETRNYPLLGFVDYYLRSRDAVALSNLKASVKELVAWSEEPQAIAALDPDARRFWLIAGLIESGAIHEAKRLVDDFRPKDPLLTLAIHLGCSLVAKIKPVPPYDRKVAEQVLANLDDVVSGMRNQLIQEFDSILLELRHNKPTAVDDDIENERPSAKSARSLPAPSNTKAHE